MSQQQFQLKALIVGVDKLSPALRQIQRNLSGFRRELNSFGSGGLQMAAGIGAAVGLTSKAFADFEDAGVRLKGSLMGVGGSVAPEFEKINQLALQLGNKLPGNTADFQNMMTALTQQGVEPQAILEGIGEASAFLAVQLKMAPEQAAEFAAKMRTATGTVSKDMMGLMDVIQRTSNLGVGSSDMLSGFSKLTPALEIMKVKGLEAGKAMAPLLAMAIRTGMAGESAGNAYRKMFQSFFDPSKMAGANKMLSAKGIGLDFTNGKGEFGGLDQMFTQLQKLRNLTTAERVPVLKQMFGDDAETLQVVQMMIDGGMQGYEAMRGKLEAQASLQLRVGQQLGTLKNLFDAAMGNAQNLLATIGEVYAPQIKGLVEGLGGFAAWAQDFVRNNPRLIQAVTMGAAAFTSVKLAALGGALALGYVNNIMKVINLTMKGNPWYLAFQAIAIAASLIFTYWEPITGFFKTMWDNITTFFSDGWEGIKYILEQMKAVIGPLMSGLSVVWNKAGNFFGGGAQQGAQGQTRPLAGAIAAQSQRVSGAIDVRFANAPQGMRVNTASNQSGLGLNPDVGYNSFATGMPY